MCLLRIFFSIAIFLPFAANSAAAVSPAGDSSLELDPISAGCLTCHEDSMTGQRVKFCLLGQQGCGGHIVSVSYAEVAARNNKLVPFSSLPPELILLEGKITCATCHGNDPHTGEVFVIDNRGSALCRACHLK